MNNNSGYNYPSTTREEHETSPADKHDDSSISAAEGSSHNNSNKRQKLNNNDTVDPSVDFLNFDYGFPLNSTEMTQQDSIIIPDDYFMFVTDKEQPQPGSSESSVKLINTSDSLNITSSTDTPSPPFEQYISPPQQPHDKNNDNNIVQNAYHRLPPNTSNDPPNQAVHTIVVGGKPFRLSWESLKSDGPTNFFLEYFRKKKTKIMHIDRDPDIFDLVVRHLRGYYIRSNDDIENQALLFDANYYGLKRLKKLLQEYLYVNVGGRVFRLPWSLFQKDGARNFFTGPLMHTLLSPSSTDQENTPPIYIDRDPDIFADIVNHLRGYTIHIRDEMHRKNLLRDAQYYVFRQLSDKLLTAQQTVAGFGEGLNLEVLVLLQDIRLVNLSKTNVQVQYKLQEGPPRTLLVQVADICLQIHKKGPKLTYEMNEMDMKKMKNMAQALKTTVNNEMHLGDDCAITIDDDMQVKSLKECLEVIEETNWELCEVEKECEVSRLILQRAICGVQVIDDRLTLCALRLEAISSRFRLNFNRKFLSG